MRDVSSIEAVRYRCLRDSSTEHAESSGMGELVQAGPQSVTMCLMMKMAAMKD